MFLFGEAAPPSPKWWAPWAYACFFGAFAGALTYAAATYMAPLDSDRWFMWSSVVTLWLGAGAMFVRAVFVTLRFLRPRGRT